MSNKINAAVTLTVAIELLRMIIERVNPSQGVYWECEFQKAIDKKIVDGHDVSNPLAFFLVPLLGKGGRKMTDAQRAAFPGENPHSFPLVQFEYVISRGWTGKDAHETLRALSKNTPSVIADGVYGSHARQDSKTWGSVAGRELGNEVGNTTAPKVEKAIASMSLLDAEFDSKLSNSERVSRLSTVDALLARYSIKPVEPVAAVEVPATIPANIPATRKVTAK